MARCQRSAANGISGHLVDGCAGAHLRRGLSNGAAAIDSQSRKKGPLRVANTAAPSTVRRNRGPTLLNVRRLAQLQWPHPGSVAVRQITGVAELRLFVMANTPEKSASLSLRLPK
jgi:hypothetical protein